MSTRSKSLEIVDVWALMISHMLVILLAKQAIAFEQLPAALEANIERFDAYAIEFDADATELDAYTARLDAYDMELDANAT